LKVSSQEEYGLRCMLQVAAQPPTEPMTLTEIARREGMSVPYVAKLMAALRQSGLVESVRGRSGGYVLSRPPARISVLDVILALGEQLFDSEYCDRYHGANDESCVHSNGCSIRSVWTRVESIVSDVLRRISLADLIRFEEEALLRSLDNRSKLSALLHLEPRETGASTAVAPAEGRE
jgi:Rrf2 family protein